MVDGDDQDVNCDGDDDLAFPLEDCTFLMDPYQVEINQVVNLNQILKELRIRIRNLKDWVN